MAETHDERISRVEQMTEDTHGHTWDLSDNDQEALKTVLRDRERLLSALQALGSKPDGYCFCVSLEQVAAGHTGECRDAQAAIAQAESTS